MNRQFGNLKRRLSNPHGHWITYTENSVSKTIHRKSEMIIRQPETTTRQPASVSRQLKSTIRTPELANRQAHI